MSINAYTGLMGSGKSYECVSTAIVDAVAAGRRVVTNVDGIDSDEVRIYAHETKRIPFDRLGHVVHCTNDDVLKADFLPHGLNVDTFCKAGDLVCIDEAWRFWGSDSKILPEHFIFFREHRHYVDEVTKVSCDLALMVQDINDLHRKVKYVVEMTIRTTKIKSLGMNKTYRVEIWEGYKTNQNLKVRTEVKKYDKAVFPLYSSYEGGKGKELQIDDRQNLLKSKKLWFMVAGFIIALFFAINSLSSFFSGKEIKKPAAKSASSAPQNNPVQSINSPIGKQANFSETYRAAGYYTANNQTFVVVEDANRRLRLETAAIFTEPRSVLVIGTMDGQKVTSFSGAAPGALQTKGDKK